MNVPVPPTIPGSSNLNNAQIGTLKLDDIIGSVAAPAGTNHQLQYNNNGVFGGDTSTTDGAGNIVCNTLATTSIDMLGGALGNAFSVAAAYIGVFNGLQFSDQLNGIVTLVAGTATVTVFNNFLPNVQVYVTRAGGSSALGFLCIENVINNHFDIVSRDSTGNVVAGDTSVVSWVIIGAGFSMFL